MENLIFLNGINGHPLSVSPTPVYGDYETARHAIQAFGTRPLTALELSFLLEKEPELFEGQGTLLLPTRTFWTPDNESGGIYVSHEKSGLTFREGRIVSPSYPQLLLSLGRARNNALSEYKRGDRREAMYQTGNFNGNLCIGSVFIPYSDVERLISGEANSYEGKKILSLLVGASTAERLARISRIDPSKRCVPIEFGEEIREIPILKDKREGFILTRGENYIECSCAIRIRMRDGEMMLALDPLFPSTQAGHMYRTGLPEE
jgi:hypothetical protein